MHKPELHTEQTLARRLSPSLVVTQMEPLDVHVAASETTLTIAAAWPRECLRQVEEDVTVTQASSGSMLRRTRDRNPPQTITRSVGVVRRPCAIVAVGVPLRVALSSGAIVNGVTDETGRLVLLLNAGEQLVSATPGPIAAPRPEVFAPRQPPRPPVLPAPLPSPSQPHAPAAPLDSAASGKDLASTLTRTAYARAKAGDCATVRTLALQVKLHDPSFYVRVFAANATLAACLPKP